MVKNVEIVAYDEYGQVVKRCKIDENSELFKELDQAITREHLSKYVGGMPVTITLTC